nr:hypothetical protein CFP56_16274 [Quercus suber]
MFGILLPNGLPEIIQTPPDKPFPCASVLFIIASLFTGKEWHKTLTRVQDGAPRAILMAGLEVLAAIPFVWLWTLMVRWLARHPGFRTWMLGGAVMPVLILVMLTIGVAVADGNDLTDWRSWELLGNFSELAHIGFAGGAALASTSFAKRRYPAPTDEGDEQHDRDVPASRSPRRCDEEQASAAFSEKSGAPAASKATATEAKDDFGPSFGRTLLLTWLVEVQCEKIFFKGLPDLSQLWTTPNDASGVGGAVRRAGGSRGAGDAAGNRVRVRAVVVGGRWRVRGGGGARGVGRRSAHERKTGGKVVSFELLRGIVRFSCKISGAFSDYQE